MHVTSLGMLCLVATLSTSAVAQDREAKVVVGPPAPAVTSQDWSWYPLAEKPPFVGDLVEDEDAHDLIHAGAALFTAGDPPVLPAELRLDADRGSFSPGWFIVHFDAPVRADDKAWLDDLTGPTTRGDGTSVARWYLPNQAMVAWVDSPAVRAELIEGDNVSWVGRYEPAYKLDPSLGTAPLTSPDRVGRTTWQLNLDLIPGHPAENVAAAVRALGGTVLETVELRGRSVYDVRFVVAQVTGAQILPLARIEGVRMIQESGDGLAMYDVSGGGKLQNRQLAVDDGTNSPIVTAASFPLWVTHDLQGQGQLVGIVDTSLDWNNVGTTGCNFGFPNTAIDNYGFALPNLSTLLIGSVGTGGVNLKIPRSDELGGATLLGIDANEHGAGVAGAAAADFYGNDDTRWWEHDVDTWESWAPSNYSGLLGPGIAHEAQIFFTPVMDSNNGFRWESFGEFEAHMNTTLDNMANAGVSATSHSVGLAEASNTYTQVSVVHDTNAFDHQDMLQCMAAGNDGAVANALSSQAVVKNSLTVGASDDVLKPEDRATFSSIGPSFDGRTKPEVMVPGTDTAPRTGGVSSLLILPNTNGSSSASCKYQWTSGTSFSAPTATGASALVHQYFEELRYPGTGAVPDPSSALIKAMLVNAGHRLTGANLGNGQYPNSYQGWGEPDLSSVLDFGSGARSTIVTDIPSAAGFNGSGSANETLTFNVDGSSQNLRVTLVWTDEPGSAGTGKKLINDLDLRVTAPGGTTYGGNVFNGTTGFSITGGSADTLNNTENVHLASPATGAWTATVDPGAGNYAVGQGFALVVTGDVSESGGGGPQAPVAGFSGSPLSGQGPLLVSFTDQSTGDIDTWSWTFGDGGSSNAASPSHSYTSPGTYDVTLTVTGPGGSDGETKNGYVTVDPPPPTGGGLYYISFLATTTVPGVGNVRDEDVVTYDPSSDTWAWYFDGSDVGIGSTDINALHVLADGTLVMSFNASNFSVPGLTGGPNGTTVEDSDLVLFAFTQSGSNTSGSFQFIFDGSDVGLTTNGEDIDGVYEFPGGGLAISTLGSAGVSGVSGVRDEDVMLFNATQFGSTTTGTWSMYFDGSDVGFSSSSSEDLSAVTFEDGEDMLFSTVGNWSASGGSGTDEDVGRFSGTFGASTSGSASLELDLSALGIDVSEDVDGLCFISGS